MFGFSIPKIIFLLFILIIIWNLFRYFENRSLNKKNTETGNDKKSNSSEESLVECKACRNFYSSKLPEGCPICNKEK